MRISYYHGWFYLEQLINVTSPSGSMATNSRVTPPPSGGLRERKKQQTREDLLAVAQSLFAENEFVDVTIEQIAERANVSPKTFFNYFKNKSDFLSESLLSWLKGIGFWSVAESPITDCRSALIPPDAYNSLIWIANNRRIFKMALLHTDFFDFIYKLDEDSSVFDKELHDIIRAPRRARIEQGQQSGVVRPEIPATDVCRLYDALRIDMVRRWLYLPDDLATPEGFRREYEIMIDALIGGLDAGTPS